MEFYCVFLSWTTASYSKRTNPHGLTPHTHGNKLRICEIWSSHFDECWDELLLVCDVIYPGSYAVACERTLLPTWRYATPQSNLLLPSSEYIYIDDGRNRLLWNVDACIYMCLCIYIHRTVPVVTSQNKIIFPSHLLVFVENIYMNLGLNFLVPTM